MYHCIWKTILNKVKFCCLSFNLKFHVKTWQVHKKNVHLTLTKGHPFSQKVFVVWKKFLRKKSDNWCFLIFSGENPQIQQNDFYNFAQSLSNFTSDLHLIYFVWNIFVLKFCFSIVSVEKKQFSSFRSKSKADLFRRVRTK